MIKSKITQITSKYQNNFILAAKTNDANKCAHVSYDAFSSQSSSAFLGVIGHQADVILQKNQISVTLMEAFSNQYSSILPFGYIHQIKTDSHYHNFSSSNQQFTMLTEAVISYNLPIMFPNLIKDCNLVMGRSIDLKYFHMFHTGQQNCDFRITNNLPSGKNIILYGDSKRSSMNVIDSRIKNYLNTPGSSKPIYSNIHITNDIDSQHIVSFDTYDYLRQQLKDTKDFYVINRSFYTAAEYEAITEAVNESLSFEKAFVLTGKVKEFNKILYNASKFVTSDEICKLLNIPKLFP